MSAAIGEELFFGGTLGVPGRAFALEGRPFLLELRLELAAERARSISRRDAQRAGRFLVLAAASLELRGQRAPLFVERLPGLTQRQPLDLQLAIDLGPQAGPLRGDLVSQSQDHALLLFQVADQRLAGADFFVEIVFPGLEVGLPLEHVLFELVDPQPGAAPLLIEQGVLFVQRVLPPLQFLSFGPKMGGNLGRLPENFFLAPGTAGGRWRDRSG